MEIRYQYRDARGDLRYVVERRYPKGFRILGPNGQELPNPVPENLAVLYRLPDVLAAHPARTVFVAEGEKDADRLVELGLVATTNPCGTWMGWLPHYSDALRDRHVVILPDADSPGREHAATVLAAVSGKARTAVIVDLHATQRGPWDVSDWLDRGGTVEDLEREVEKARFLAAGLKRRKAGPIKRERIDLVLSSELSTREKLLLLVLVEKDGEVRLSMRQLGQLCSLHRVSAQRIVGRLRRAGVLREGTSYPIAWDVMAALCAAAGRPVAPVKPSGSSEEPSIPYRATRKRWDGEPFPGFDDPWTEPETAQRSSRRR